MLLAFTLLQFTRIVAQTPFDKVMPGKKDFIVKYWKDGYVNPQHQPLLQVLTGWYGFSLDVINFRFLHFNTGVNGNVSTIDPAVATTMIGKGDPATLEVSFTAKGKRYRLVPLTCAIDTAIKLLEDGTWLARHVWPALAFKDKNETWPGTASMELAAWPGQVVFAIKFNDASESEVKDVQIEMTAGGKRINGAVHTQIRGNALSVTTTVAVDKQTIAVAGKTTVQAGFAGDEFPANWDAATARWLVSMPAKEEVPAAIAHAYPSLLDYREDIHFYVKNNSRDTSAIPVSIEKIISSRIDKIALKKTLPITGLCFVVYDDAGSLTGLPVQVSKNWHTTDRIYDQEGDWYRGSFLLRLPPSSSVRFTVQIVRGNWDGLAASTLAQLCLIGWPGKYSLDWHQVAVGNWGESITYSPEGLLGNTLICDWRPLYVPGRDKEQYNWTANLGGGDWLLYQDEQGKRQRIKEVMTGFNSYGPLLSEISYTGTTADQKIRANIRAVTFAANDLNRTVFHVRYDVLENTGFTRLAFFQMGADMYNWHKAMALTGGTANEKSYTIPTNRIQMDPGQYLMKPVPVNNLPSWIAFTGSFPEREMDIKNNWTWANRGLILREWNAVLNGKEEKLPFVSSYVTLSANCKSNNAELVPPASVTSLQKGDYIEFCIEGIIPPKLRSDYYGTDTFLIGQLQSYPDSWELFSAYTERNHIDIVSGKEFIQSRHPLVIRVRDDAAIVGLRSSAGRVPVKFTGLSGYDKYSIQVSQGKKQYETGTATPSALQVEYDAKSRTWSITTFIKNNNDGDITVRISRNK